MKLEIASGFKIGEIAMVAGVLVDEMVKTDIPGTNFWPNLKQRWIDHIRGAVTKRGDLKAYGLQLGYRGYIDNVIHYERRGLSVVFDEPRILVFADEEILTVPQLINVGNIIHEISSDHLLRQEEIPPSVVFPKEIYASEVIIYDSNELNIQ